MLALQAELTWRACGAHQRIVSHRSTRRAALAAAAEAATAATLKGIVAESDSKQGRLLFKLAVEMAVMMNLMAADRGIDRTALERLRGECVKEVKRLNGSFSFEDALDWQRG